MSEITLEAAKIKIANLISPYANEFDDPRLGQFLALSIGRILLNQYNKTKDEKILKDKKTDDFRHITDWIKAAIINNDQWISNIDSDQRPKKLMKFASIEQVMQEANKSMLISAQKNATIKLDAGHEELVAELSDGYYVVKLLTPEALDRESGQMQHCIGQGAYDKNLENPKFSYLSLRDPAGNAHASLEIENNMIIQAQGKQNKAIIRKYEHILVPFLEKQGYSVNQGYFGIKLSYIRTDDGKWHDIYRLPEGLTIDDLEYKNSDIKEEIILPNNLTVRDRLNLENVNINILPHGLKVYTMSLEKVNIKKIPDDLEVLHSLSLRDVPVTDIPPTVKIGKTLLIKECVNFNKLPDGLIIKDSLVLNRLPLFTELPKRLKIADRLFLNRCPVEKLPDDLIIGKALNIDNTPISEIPDTIKISDGFSAKNTKIIKFPNLKNVTGNIDVSNTGITEIPNNLYVTGDFNISGCDIKELPDNFVIGSYAVFEKLPITSIPEGAKFHDDIQLDSTNIIHFPIKRVYGHLDLSNTKYLQSLPKGLEVERGLFLKDSNISILPENMDITETLELRDSMVYELPKGLKTGKLSILDTEISELPDDIRVTKLITMAEGQIEHFPDTISDRVELYIQMSDGNGNKMLKRTVGEFRAAQKNNYVLR